jgi:DNA-binding IclR family transcriptional regulator
MKTLQGPERCTGLTVAEFAVRWEMPETRARRFLVAFRDAGFVEELPGGFWRVTELALADGGLQAFASGEPMVSDAIPETYSDAPVLAERAAAA